MIVGNGVRLSGNPSRLRSAPLAHSLVRANWNQRGALYNWFTASDASKKDGIPSGMRHPQVWLLPIRAGALASRGDITGDGEITGGNLAGGVNGTADIAGVGEITADAALLGFLTTTLAGLSDTAFTATALGQALTTITGTGTVGADITSVLNGVADLLGYGSLTADAVATLAATADLAGSAQTSAVLAGAIAAAAALSGAGAVAVDLTAITQGLATLTGSGTIPPATLTALGLALANLAGVGDFAASADAKGSMSADISLGASVELSPESIAASVRARIMDTELDGYSIEDIIRLTSAALLGKSSGGQTAPVFRSLDDTADRVAGEVDALGNRTASVLTP